MLTKVKLLPIAFDKFKPKQLTWIVQLYNNASEYLHVYEGEYKTADEKAKLWRDFAGIPLERVKANE